MAVIVPPSTDPVPEDLPANTIVGLQSQGRLPPRAQSLYDRTYSNSSGMTDMMGGMRLDLPNIAAGLTQHETASNAPTQFPSMPPPPGVAQEPSPPQNQNAETDVNKIYAMLNELLEQLSANRQASIQLHSLAAGVKSQVVHSQTGYVLRRFNMDRTQEEYNGALEKMNAQMSSENNALLNDNKQLGTLIKEYEQTLENVMTAFRVRANEVQQRELAIVREYEQKILATETVQLEAVLSQQTDFSSSLGRTGELLRVLMRALGGEDPTSVPKSMLASIVEAETGTASTGMGTGRDGEIDITSTAGHMAVGRHPQNRIINSLELEVPLSPLPATTALPDPPSTSSVASTSSSPPPPPPPSDDNDNDNDNDTPPSPEEPISKIDLLTDKEAQLIAADWALERECELARLERENAVLRQLLQEREKLDLVTVTSGANVTLPGEEPAPRLELPRLTTLPKRAFKGKLGGKDIGPYGMYKKFEE